MQGKVVRNIVIAELTLFGFLAVTMIVWPHPIVYSVSYYLAYLPSFAFLGIGLVASDIFVIRAAKALPRGGATGVIRIGLFMIATLMVGMLLTPYTWSAFFNWAHTTVGTLLFLVQFVLSIWLTARELPSILNHLMVLLEIVGGLAAMLSLLNSSLALLFQGEILFQVAFSILLLASIDHLLADPLPRLNSSRHSTLHGSPIP
ncbi:MAG: hypothetical protein ACYDHP_03040 [Ferrimicrobium sp.]